jgi:hypothetical protein
MWRSASRAAISSIPISPTRRWMSRSSALRHLDAPGTRGLGDADVDRDPAAARGRITCIGRLTGRRPSDADAASGEHAVEHLCVVSRPAHAERPQVS